MAISKLVTGGQTGVDRASLDVAIELGIPYGGWCPKGRLAEDGTIDAKYLLTETTHPEYEQRTEWNARDSDGTLILSFGELNGGTKLTADCAEKYNKPYLILDALKDVDREKFQSWVTQHNITVINVAGPRESHQPGTVYSRSLEVLRDLLS